MVGETKLTFWIKQTSPSPLQYVHVTQREEKKTKRVAGKVLVLKILKSNNAPLNLIYNGKAEIH